MQETLSSGSSKPSRHRSMQGRHDWVLADLRCILCGRVQGKLVGMLFGGVGPLRPTAWSVRQFSAYRPLDPSQPAVRLTGREKFRCLVCGGGVIVDEAETFTTYDELEMSDEDEPRPRRGRPPKPWRKLADTRFADRGLAG